MSRHLKTLDSNHLVTVGEEGYWATNDPMAQYNPGNGWASLTGQNFSAQHSTRNIDFAAIHYWPDLWVCIATACIVPFAWCLRLPAWQAGPSSVNWVLVCGCVMLSCWYVRWPGPSLLQIHSLHHCSLQFDQACSCKLICCCASRVAGASCCCMLCLLSYPDVTQGCLIVHQC